MKILVVYQHYAPEPFRITDICEELARRGHSVTVLTGVPNYPMGRVYPGYGRGRNREETRNGVRVLRCFTIARRRGVFFRFLNYYSFALSSLCRSHFLRGEFDVVLAHQTSPVMMAYAAIHYKKRHALPMILYCLDLWPASLAAGGVRETSPLYRFYHWVSGRVYRKADTLLVASGLFTDYLAQEFGIPRERMRYLPQYAEGLFLSETDKARPPKDGFDFVFAGNVGAAQSVETILRAAALLEAERQDVRWHIVGDGSDLACCQRLAKTLGLRSVIFHGRRPLEEMPGFYARADALLVTLMADPVLSLTLPGKVQSYMAAGRPLLCAADGETARVIARAQCGYCCRACDAQGLADAAKNLMADGGREGLGENARRYYLAHFSAERFYRTLEDALQGGGKR